MTRPVDTLHKAAALMRTRAEEATSGRWVDDDSTLAAAVYSEGEDFYVTPPTDWDAVPTNTAHIASWDPLVAIAVADWLRLVARAVTAAGGVDDASLPTQANYLAALTVAHTYLREPA